MRYFYCLMPLSDTDTFVIDMVDKSSRSIFYKMHHCSCVWIIVKWICMNIYTYIYQCVGVSKCNNSCLVIFYVKRQTSPSYIENCEMICCSNSSCVECVQYMAFHVGAHGAQCSHPVGPQWWRHVLQARGLQGSTLASSRGPSKRHH